MVPEITRGVPKNPPIDACGFPVSGTKEMRKWNQGPGNENSSRQG